MGEKLERIVYPVGQGGFYSERLFVDGSAHFTIVYDCGSLNRSNLEIQIDNSGIEKIDLLVLSHFHDDHINGLKYLSRKGIAVKTIVMPQLENAEIILYFFDSTNLEIYQNPAVLFPGCRVVRVRSEDDSNKNELSAESLPNSISHNIKVRPRTGGLQWTFKFYVDKSTYGNKFSSDDREYLSNLNINSINDDSHKKRIKKIHEKISPNLNLTSMCMYSGPNDYYWSKVSSWGAGLYGTILTGDILLKNEKTISNFISHYYDFLDCIGYFQIPHHGSRHNMTRTISEFKLKRAFIQAGIMNAYGHPSNEIVKMHIDSDIEIQVITENEKQMRF